MRLFRCLLTRAAGILVVAVPPLSSCVQSGVKGRFDRGLTGNLSCSGGNADAAAVISVSGEGGRVFAVNFPSFFRR